MESEGYFVYFADSRCLQREEVRRFCLRLPEVITELRKVQKESHHEDVFLLLWEKDMFGSLEFSEQVFFFNVIQRALFSRFQKRMGSRDCVVLRTEGELNQVLESVRLSREVWVIGPLMDEVLLRFMKKGGRLRNFLEEDVVLRDVFSFSETPEIRIQ